MSNDVSSTRRLPGGARLLLGGSLLVAALTLAATGPAPDQPPVPSPGFDLSPYRNVTVGDTTTNTLDPDAYLTDELESTVETLPDGTVVRTFEVHVKNKEIEIAPGVMFPAWTYNGHVPGPTLRAREGERIRIHFTNLGDRPHSMHFHGFHTAAMDAAMPFQQVAPNFRDAFMSGIADFLSCSRGHVWMSASRRGRTSPAMRGIVSSSTGAGK